MIAALDRPSRQTHIRDMAGTITNELLLEHMKAMRAELAALAVQIRELRDRQTETHAAVVALRRDQAADAEVAATLAVRVDRISDRVEIIEKRLELVD